MFKTIWRIFKTRVFTTIIVYNDNNIQDLWKFIECFTFEELRFVVTYNIAAEFMKYNKLLKVDESVRRIKEQV